MKAISKCLIYTIGALFYIGCSPRPTPVSTLVDIHKLDSLTHQYIDSVYHTPLMRDSLFDTIVKLSDLKNPTHIAALRFWVNNIPRSAITHYLSTDYNYFWPHLKKYLKTFNLGSFKLVTAHMELHYRHDSELYLFLIDKNDKIICHKVIDMLSQMIVDQRLVDRNGDNNLDLVLRIKYHPQCYESNFELVYSLKDNKFELIFAFEFSSEDFCIDEEKIINHYRSIGGNKFKITSNIKGLKYNEELDKRCWAYKTTTSVVSLDELLSEFEDFK